MEYEKASRLIGKDLNELAGLASSSVILDGLDVRSSHTFLLLLSPLLHGWSISWHFLLSVFSKLNFRCSDYIISGSALG